MSDWRNALLKTMGLPKTPQNLKFLGTWQQSEGGHTNNSARFNWLNTTRDAPGAVGSMNSVGVKIFDNFNNGIRATAATLMSDYYQDIVLALGSGNPYKHDLSKGLSTWVRGPNGGIHQSYVDKIMGGSAIVTPKVERARALATRKRAEVAAVPRNVGQDDSWDKAMRLIFDDDPEFAEIMAGMDDTVAQKSGIVSKGGSLKPVPLDPKAPGKANTIVSVAATQLGKPYVFGSGPSTDDFDCSDLIQWAYKQAGVNISRTTFTQIKEGRSVKGQKLQPGDLFFSGPGHVMMYVGGGKLISAPYTGTVVQYKNVSDYGTPYEVRRIL